MFKILALFNRHIFSKIARIVFLLCFDRSKYRFLDTNPAAIGHLTLDVDCFLKERALGLHTYTGILLCPKNKVANDSLVDCWDTSQHLWIIRNNFICFLCDYLRIFNDTRFDCSVYHALKGRPFEVFRVENLWNGRPPIIKLSSSVERKGRDVFNSLFPKYKGEKIALLHCRDSQYDKKTGNVNFFTQNHRNSNIESYDRILQFLKEKDFICIRIGDYSVEAKDGGKYTDISHLNKDQRVALECYLASIQSLFLGSSSGPGGYAIIWNKPLFALNILPYNNIRRATRNSVAIPKALEKDGKIISAAEIFSEGIYRFHYDSEYQEKAIQPLQNKPNEVFEDFLMFYEVYVEKNKEASVHETFSKINKKYKELVRDDAGDFYAQSQIGAHFMRETKIL